MILKPEALNSLYPKVVRTCAGYTFLFGLLMIFEGISRLNTGDEDLETNLIIIIIVAILLAPAWYARKFGLPDYSVTMTGKVLSSTGLLVGIVLYVLFLYYTYEVSGEKELVSKSTVALLLLMPILISSLAVILSKKKGVQ